MLKFRADTPESRRQLAARREERSAANLTDGGSFEKDLLSNKSGSCDTDIYEEVNLNGSLKDISGDEKPKLPPPRDQSRPSSSDQTQAPSREQSQDKESQSLPKQNEEEISVRQKETIPKPKLQSQISKEEEKSSPKPPSPTCTNPSINKEKPKSIKKTSDGDRKWSISSGEFELSQATLAKPTKKDNNSNNTKRKWSLPDTDSDDDFAKRQEIWAASGSQRNVTSGRPTIGRFNLPSDSEEEDPYATAKSPSMSIKSAAPPLPPPVSTIPKNHTSIPRAESVSPTPAPVKTTVQMSAHVALRKRSISTAPDTEDLRKRSITSASDTDPYDEIDYNNDKPQIKQKASSENIVKENAVKDNAVKENAGVSEPRFKFTLNRGKTRLNPPEPTDETYSEIPKKAQWNFPSSSEEEDDDNESGSKGKSKRPMSKTKTRGLSRQESTTSEEGERPVIPPKLWETQGLDYNDIDEVESGEEEVELRRSSSDSGIREKNTEEPDDDITIEYSALQRTDSGRKGSLLGPDELDDDVQGSPRSTHSSGFGENHDMIDGASVLSENSSKAVTDYEQSSTCVDMDQLSLDSSGKRPKRIVETHETHEIVPADNNEDDIVERIIETQTITEKLDDNGHTFSDYQGEDLDKYLNNDDEFVSHIFTLGRTIEKGKGGGRRRDRLPKDFAFVENPFSAPEPVIETMPLEKKIVKQKITTLVKKKKATDEAVYAEVQPASYPYGDTSDMSLQNSPRPGGSFWEDDGSNPGDNNFNPGSPRLLEDGTQVFTHEHINEINDNNFIKSTTTEKRKEPKSEKKSIFKGMKKLFKKKDRSFDDRGNQLVLEDDYQEFVP